MRKALVVGVLGTAVALGTGIKDVHAQAAGAPAVKLVANVIKAQDDFATKAFQMFAERVAQYTNGKVVVEVHFGGELGYKAADSLRILENHSVDISETIGAFEGATVPDIMITTLPFFITSFDEFAFFDRMFRPHLDKLFAQRKAKCLLSYSLTLQHFWNKKPITKMADLAGVKMRAYDKVTNDMLLALGAIPLRVDFTEVYMALQQGTVDGVVTSIASIISLKAHEVVSTANLTGFSTGGVNCLAINLDAWNKLAPEHKVGMMQAAAEVEDWLRVRVPELEREGLDTLRSRGMKINVVPAETIAEMRKRTEKIRTDFLTSQASPELKAIVDQYERIRGLK